MKQPGFTVVELTVVAFIMAILITLAVVNVRSTQLEARDSERHTDTQNIATALESFYNATHSGLWSDTYPGRLDIAAGAHAANYLRDNTGAGSLHAPGIGVDQSWSVVLATNSTQTTSGVRPVPTIDTYVYQPLTGENNTCTAMYNTCVKYNLFYRLEKPTDDCPAPNNICMIRSTHQ